MEKLTLKVNDMSCEHCVAVITTEVGALSGVSNVVVDLKAKTVTVEHNPIFVTADTIKSKIKEQGYDVVV
ncbi:MAG: copper ion binding protein [Nitrososphaerota archaeon]|jgi:copper chaperone|nr:copper ion binding protein [Nitrososphaerota archaeon]